MNKELMRKLLEKLDKKALIDIILDRENLDEKFDNRGKIANYAESLIGKPLHDNRIDNILYLVGDKEVDNETLNAYIFYTLSTFTIKTAIESGTDRCLDEKVFNICVTKEGEVTVNTEVEYNKKVYDSLAKSFANSMKKKYSRDCQFDLSISSMDLPY